VLREDVQEPHRADLQASHDHREWDVGRRGERLVEPDVEVACERRVAPDRRIFGCGRAQPLAVPFGERLGADDPPDERLFGAQIRRG
jgi:hypothetical protein